MDYPIPSGAPGTYSLGTEDISTRQVPRVPLAIPQHCAKVFLVAQSGPEDETLAVGSVLTDTFGLETFNPRGRFFNHQTLLATGFNTLGNLMMVKRITPDNARKAFVTLCLELLPIDVDQYTRLANGKYLLDGAGNPTVSGTTKAGYRAKWTASVAYATGTDPIHVDGTPLLGSMVNGAVTGTRYPIVTFEHNFASDSGNLVAVSLWGRDLDNSTSMPTAMMNKYRAYPVNISLLTKSEETATPTIKGTLVGSRQSVMTFKKDVYDPVSDIPMYVGEAFVDRYQSIKDPRYAKVYGEIGKTVVYHENLETVLGLVMSAEKAASGVTGANLPVGCDFAWNAPDTDRHLFNIWGGVTSAGAPYNTFVFSDDNDSVSLSQSNQVFLKNGSSGTITDAEYNTKVRAYMRRYSDRQDPLTNIAKHVETNIYDTGFEMATKMEIARFISIRKNTLVHLGTFVEGVEYQDVESELSSGRVLQSYAQMFPESDYFGTSTFRCTITPGDMILRNSRYLKRVSMVYERAMKRAAYMGASNGAWTNGKHYDGDPGSIITSGTEIRPDFVPNVGVLAAWDSGMVFAAQFDTESHHFPCFKTVYNNDTSVLNSDIIASAIAHINTVTQAVHRKYQGTEGKTADELTVLYNNEINARLKGKFDNRYRITPMAQFTSLDTIRGYSITVPVKIEGSVMTTVMTTYVVASRYES